MKVSSLIGPSGLRQPINNHVGYAWKPDIAVVMPSAATKLPPPSQNDTFQGCYTLSGKRDFRDPQIYERKRRPFFKRGFIRALIPYFNPCSRKTPIVTFNSTEAFLPPLGALAINQGALNNHWVAHILSDVRETSFGIITPLPYRRC